LRPLSAGFDADFLAAAAAAEPVVSGWSVADETLDPGVYVSPIFVASPTDLMELPKTSIAIGLTFRPQNCFLLSVRFPPMVIRTERHEIVQLMSQLGGDRLRDDVVNLHNLRVSQPAHLTGVIIPNQRLSLPVLITTPRPNWILLVRHLRAFYACVGSNISSASHVPH
jgi:hypothetical protein